MDDSSARRLYSAFGQLVRLQRERSTEAMTQEKLGRLVGLSRTSITNIECGRQHITLHHLFALAKTLKVSPAALLPPTDSFTNDADVDELSLAEKDKDITEWAKRVVRK